jgi:hypothetical protein
MSGPSTERAELVAVAPSSQQVVGTNFLFFHCWVVCVMWVGGGEQTAMKPFYAKKFVASVRQLTETFQSSPQKRPRADESRKCASGK